MGSVVYRTLIFYGLLLAVIRMMGKREIGSLSPFDLAVTIMVAELAALPIENEGLPLIKGILPILTLVGAEMILSFITIKSERVSKFINGTPSIVIRDGIILEKEMRRLRYSLSDLVSQLRIKSVPNVSDVEVAILETNGELSVIPKAQKRPVTPADLELDTEFEGLPLTLISDGKVNYKSLEEANLDMTWLQQQLRDRGIYSTSEVFFASLDTTGNLFVQRKVN